MKNKTTKPRKKFKMKKSPRTDGTAVAPASKTVTTVGRAVLEKLSTTTLYKLLQYKNVPLRSKLRTKEDRIERLRGTVTVAELVDLGVDTSDIVAGPARHPEIEILSRKRDAVRPGKGIRLNVPVAGNDVHADNIVVAIATDDGITWRGTFENTNDDIANMIRVLLHHGVQHVAMESTAEYWLKACWALQEAGIEVLVANAKQVAATQGVKTDHVDAGRLALAFRDGRLKPSILCTPEQFRMRKLNRDRITKVQHASSAITRVKRIMRQYDAPEWLMEISSSVRVQRILSRALKPGALPRLRDIVTEEYARYRGAITDPDVLEMMAKELGSFLQRIGGTGDKIRLITHLEDYHNAWDAAKAFQNTLLAMIKKDEKLVKNLRLILTLPSVSLNVALTFLVEVLDIRFFWRPESLVKWCGMAPRVKQSGRKKRKNGKLYKGGNKFMRTAAYLAAKTDHAHSKHPGHPIGRFVRRLYKDRKKSYKTAVIAGGAKLLRYLYHVLALGKPFQEIYADEECEKLKENRERKLDALDKAMGGVELQDLLEHAANRLAKSRARLDDTIAKQVELLASMMLDTSIALECG